MAQTPPTGSRKPYSGPYRSLVVAIDVGTTFSGVSYAILEPGEIPKIHGVTRFPGQEHVAGNTKIPSAIYYDKQGKLMAAGAEADAATIISQAEDDGWTKVELFKLRLRPRTMRLNMNGMRFSPLPKKKTPVHVFGDFLAYLYHCTRKFITDTHANGAALWNTVENNIQFVLSHPNGWEGPQQSKMRRAAIYGGLIPDTNAGKARIWFVTEGEASLHACVLSGLAADVLSSPSQHGFLIADAGGGTLDISSYGIKATSPLVMEEIAPPDCIFAGSVFVSRRAREFLEEKLKNSKYGTPDALDHITKKFDETTKRLFRDKKDLQFIPFGSPLDKDPAVGIRSGQLKLTGQEVANLFEPSVEAAVNAIKAQIDASRGMIKSVFLVGGYAASPWLFSQLKERLARYGVSVSRPDSQTSKAVADGAIGFFCDHHVSARMSKFMYGVEYLREFDQSNEDHAARMDRLCELPSGPKLLPDAFDCILARSVQVKESTVFTRKYSTELTSLTLLSVFEVEIWCFRGGNDVPTWIDRNSETFSTLCIVQADLSLLSGSAEPKVGTNGKQYWTIVFSVEIHFGLTEFKARIKWVDNGSTRYGPASIVYNEHGHRAIDDDEPDIYPEDDHSVGGGGTPRSERLRSLPASRARSPTEPHHPASPGSYDGNSLYAAESIRGIPPPSVSPHPHELSRERTASKPSTPKAASPVPQQIERELSTESRRGSVHSRGRERTASARSSRHNSVTGPKLSETLSAVWGAGDPQLRSPIQPQTPQSPQQPPTPTPQTPQPPQQPTPQPPQQPTPKPPSQPPTQPPTQPHTPKAKSRKQSMTASTARASPQLPPPPVQPEIVAIAAAAATPPHSSPKPPPTPRDVGQATVTPSPKPSAPASPKSAILPASRGLTRKASPPHKAEKSLSPLAAQVLQPEPMPEPIPEPEPVVVADNAGDVTGVSGTGLLDVANTEVVSGGADNLDVGAQDAWNLGDNPDASWNLGGDNSAAVVDNSLVDVPGSFTGGGGEEGLSLLDNPVPPPDSNTGAPALFSGSISSFMTSSAVSGLGSKLGSFGFGFGSGGSGAADTSSGTGLFGSNKKQDDTDFKSGLGWGSSARSAAEKAASALGTGGFGNKKQDDIELKSGPGWGSSTRTAAEKAGSALGTGGFGWGGGSGLGKASPWAKAPSAAGSKTVSPNPPATPHVPEQAVEGRGGGSGKASPWGKAPSAAGSKTVSPNPPATPHVPEQAVEGRGSGSGKASPWGKPSRSAAGSKAVSPNPPATPHVPGQAVEAAQDTAEKRKSRAVTPNPPGTPQVQEQLVEPAQSAAEKRKSRAATPNPPATPQMQEQVVEPKSKVNTPNPPATPHIPEQTVESSQAPATEEKLPEVSEQTIEHTQAAETEIPPAEVSEHVGDPAEPGAGEEPVPVEDAPQESAEAHPGDTLAEEHQADKAEAPSAEPSAEVEDVNPEEAADAEDDGFPAWGKQKKKKGQKGKQETSTPATPVAEDDWGTTVKGKKGKKGKQGPTEPPTPVTPTVEDTEWTSAAKGKKNKKKKGGLADAWGDEQDDGNEGGDAEQGLMEPPTPVTPAVEDTEWTSATKGKQNKKKKGFASVWGDTQDDGDEGGDAEQDAEQSANHGQPSETQDAQGEQGDQGQTTEVQGEPGPVDKQDGEDQDLLGGLEDTLAEGKDQGEEEEEEQNTGGGKKNQKKTKAGGKKGKKKK